MMLCKKNHSGPENFKKDRPYKLVKSNEISWFVLKYFHKK